MNSKLVLNDYDGRFLDYDGFTSVESLLESMGENIIKTIHAKGNDWFITESGYQVSSNGYVFSL